QTPEIASSIAMQFPRNDGKTDPRNNVYLIVRSRKKIDKKSQILIFININLIFILISRKIFS
ncbi:hypothetical protein, partial [Rickettsia conorii]|uniref:hypothetical protein n=1 Tax=Rickettsia conorii TaxID=781 RepID=UPI003AEF2D05